MEFHVRGTLRFSAHEIENLFLHKPEELLKGEG
jgi:hypothetical protein